MKFKNKIVLLKTIKTRLETYRKTNLWKLAKKKHFRNFRQEFDLPEDVNPYEVTSSLDSDGLLNIEAPISKHLRKFIVQDD